MNKQENFIGMKLKCILSIVSMQTPMYFQIELREHWLKCTFIDLCSDKSSEEKLKVKDLLKNIIKPIYMENEETVIINYATITSSIVKDFNHISISLFSPISPASLVLTLSNIKLAGLIFTKYISSEKLKEINKFILLKREREIKNLMGQFMRFFKHFEQLNHASSNLMKENIKQSYLTGKKYYESSMAELKKMDKLKFAVQKKFNLGQRTEEIKYFSFHSIFSEIQGQALTFLKETVDLFMKIFRQESHRRKSIKKISVAMKKEREKSINYCKQDCINNHLSTSQTVNKSENIKTRGKLFELFNPQDNVSLSTENNSDQKEDDIAIPDTPEFYKQNTKLERQDDNVVSLENIITKIEESKKSHSYVPQNNVYNIVFNTTEIIHRNFFQLCFDDYFEKLFSYEKDKNNLIKLDSIYNYFLYLRGLKNLIITNERKLLLSNYQFLEESFV